MGGSRRYSMVRPVVCFAVLLSIMAASLAWCAPDAPKAEDKAKARTARELREKLAVPVTLANGIEPNTQLGDALEQFSQKFGLPVLINAAAFAMDNQLEDAAAQPVQLPKVFNVRLSSVLRLVLDQVHGTYLIRPDYIEVTSLQQSRPEACPGNEATGGRALLPLANAEFSKIPLDAALKDLSDATDFSIVIDSRVAEKEGKTPVTATFKNVPLGAAVELLADMAGLGSVLVDNVLYVTNKANALAVDA